jgi:hypothetical protein
VTPTSSGRPRLDNINQDPGKTDGPHCGKIESHVERDKSNRPQP